MKERKVWYWIVGGVVVLIAGLVIGGLGMFGLLPWQGGDLYEDPQGRFTMQVDPSWNRLRQAGAMHSLRSPTHR